MCLGRPVPGGSSGHHQVVLNAIFYLMGPQWRLLARISTVWHGTITFRPGKTLLKPRAPPRSVVLVRPRGSRTIVATASQQSSDRKTAQRIASYDERRFVPAASHQLTVATALQQSARRIRSLLSWTRRGNPLANLSIEQGDRGIDGPSRSRPRLLDEGSDVFETDRSASRRA